MAKVWIQKESMCNIAYTLSEVERTEEFNEKVREIMAAYHNPKFPHEFFQEFAMSDYRCEWFKNYTGGKTKATQRKNGKALIRAILKPSAVESGLDVRIIEGISPGIWDDFMIIRGHRKHLPSFMKTEEELMEEALANEENDILYEEEIIDLVA